MSLRVLVVDDEWPARRKLCRFLEDEPDMSLVGEAANGEEAVTAILELKPDLVLLDIQMPGLTGFEVLLALKGEEGPRVVFVTAYDQYALQAFEAHALDYLLKPFDQDRFQACMKHVRTLIKPESGKDFDARLGKLLDDVAERAPDRIRHLLVRVGGRGVFLKPEQVDWIAASGNYVELHVGRQSYALRETMATLEGRLDPAHFARIHRGTIVNLDRVTEIQPWSKNDYLVILQSGQKLKMSRRYRHALPGVLEG